MAGNSFRKWGDTYSRRSQRPANDQTTLPPHGPDADAEAFKTCIPGRPSTANRQPPRSWLPPPLRRARTRVAREAPPGADAKRLRALHGVRHDHHGTARPLHEAQRDVAQQARGDPPAGARADDDEVRLLLLGEGDDLVERLAGGDRDGGLQAPLAQALGRAGRRRAPRAAREVVGRGPPARVVELAP